MERGRVKGKGRLMSLMSRRRITKRGRFFVRVLVIPFPLMLKGERYIKKEYCRKSEYYVLVVFIDY